MFYQVMMFFRKVSACLRWSSMRQFAVMLLIIGQSGAAGRAAESRPIIPITATQLAAKAIVQVQPDTALSGKDAVAATQSKTNRANHTLVDAPQLGTSETEVQTTADSGHPDQGHSDPIAPVLLGILVILFAAKLGGHMFEVVRQPAVLGELIVGVMIGNLSLFGITSLEFLKVDFTHHQNIDLLDYQHLAGVTIDQLARIGVILLLFQVGLESSIRQMLKVGPSALMVAVVGVVVPMGLGWGAGKIMLPQHHWTVHMFIGAALCATSVGITARVLQDLGKSKTREAQIILGAAVVDDVLGLVVLAMTQGIIVSLGASAAGETSTFGIGELLIILGKALGFLAAALLLGQYLPRPAFRMAGYLKGKGLLIVTALLICFGFSYLANAAGLATIVGAFAAGLILDEVHYASLKESHAEHSLDELVKPLIDLLVPIFFVVMGLHVDLRSFADPSVLGLAAALSVVAILGKQVCALAVLDKSVDRLSVGLGMIPRGEVGLIFAAIGLQLHIGSEQIIDHNTYSALVVMVIVTTLVTPPLLKWGMNRHNKIANELPSR